MLCLLAKSLAQAWSSAKSLSKYRRERERAACTSNTVADSHSHVCLINLSVLRLSIHMVTNINCKVSLCCRYIDGHQVLCMTSLHTLYIFIAKSLIILFKLIVNLKLRHSNGKSTLVG